MGRWEAKYKPEIKAPKAPKEPRPQMSAWQKRRQQRGSGYNYKSSPIGEGMYGALPRSVNTNLAAYDESVTLPTVSSAGNAGSGGQGIDPKAPAYIAPKASPISRQVERNGAKGTQTSPSPAKPGDLNAFADLLGSKYGIQFRGGFESNHLPNKSNYSVDDAMTMGGNLEQERAKAGGGFVETVIDGSDEKTTVVSRGEIAEGAQKGTSAVPDAGDQKRAVRVGRFDPRQRDGGSSSFMAADSGPIVEQGAPKGGISNRSRSFLDYDGPGGSMMALRAAEAQSGYIRQGGKNYAISGEKDGKREFTEFNDEGRRALVKDGNAVASQDFLKKYMMGETNAKAAENPAVENPVAVEAQLEHTNENFGPLADSEKYGQILDATRGMTGMGPLANGEVYGQYLDGRAPMMRDPRKK